MRYKINYKKLQQIENKLGDSWYILDLEKFSQNYKEFGNVFKKIYPNTEIAYSYKTNYIPEICKVVKSKGGFAEVVSEMEYDLAIKIGVEPKKIIVNGPYKPEHALEKFLINGSVVNIDSYCEISLLKKLINKYKQNIFNIGLRCNFEFSGISVSRFGFDVEDAKFYKLVEELKNIKNIRIINLHCHYPNRELQLFGERADKILKLYRKLFKGDQLLWIDIGGGLGGKLDEHLKSQIGVDIAEYKDYAKLIATKFEKEFRYDKQKPLLILEPGTALVADTMQFVCKVIEIKKIRNNYFAVVTGSKVNFHPMASKINLPVKAYGKEKAHRTYYESIDISGYTCMEGDYLYRNYEGELKIGDYLVFDNVGSYSIVFKPPFIMPNVPIISFSNGQMKILKNAETFNYIFQTYTFDK